MTDPLLQEHIDKGWSGHFVFLKDELVRNARSLSSAFEKRGLRLQPAYSIKANKEAAVLHTLLSEQVGFECASIDELRELAATVGPNAAAHVNSPLLDPTLLTLCAERGHLVYADSFDQLAELEQYARNAGIVSDVGVRLHVYLQALRPSRFGIGHTDGNIDRLLRFFMEHTHVRLVSLHCHYSGPDRSAAHLADRCLRMGKAYAELRQLGTIATINIGGGLIGRMPAQTATDWGFALPTWDDYAAAVDDAIGTTLRNNGLGLIVEPGSALVASAFSFVAHVKAIKQSGERMLAVVNTSNTVLRPTGHTRPLAFDVIPRKEDTDTLFDAPTAVEHLIVGNTCMENDVIATYRGTLKVGDALVFHNMGAYTISFAHAFIHSAPTVRMLEPLPHPLP